MALVEIDQVITTLQKELNVCLTLRQQKEARGVYGVMTRLALIHTLNSGTLRMLFGVLAYFPEGFAHAERIAMLATDEERRSIAIARKASLLWKKAMRSAVYDETSQPPLLS